MAAEPGFDRLAALERAGTSFALATVVGRHAPVSSSLGDRAIVFEDGRMEGFVGGACARDIVRRQAVAALRRGRSQLVQIRPGLPTEAPEPAGGEERIVVPMGCASEGSIDIYIEPHVPRRRLLVVGFTPVAEALARSASALDFDVTRFVEPGELDEVAPLADVALQPLDGLRDFVAGLDAPAKRRLAVVVASQGHYDEAALETLLAVPIGYLGLLASRKRAASVRGILSQAGISSEALDAIRNPIGLDIGARAPSEIAIAILAEVVTLGTSPGDEAEETAARRTEAEHIHVENKAADPSVEHVHAHVQAGTATGGEALDPICGMTVDVAHASHRLEHDGRSYYFCCAGCRAKFAAEPERYPVALERT